MTPQDFTQNRTGTTAARWSLVLLSACLLLAGCAPTKPEEAAPKASGKKPNDPAARPVLVELALVARGRIEEILERSAPLEAEAQVQVRARTQNPAIELLVEEGDQIVEGQVLLRLENGRQQTDYEQSVGRLEEARIVFQREESLFQQDLVSESVYLNAKFALNQAELQSTNAKRELDYTEVRAPIKGTITSRTVKVGDQVGPASPLFEIVDLDSTVAVINVPEQYLPKLKPEMAARLRSSTLGGRVFAGYVKRISPIVEARAGTIKVVVGVKELGPLRPGMWVDVELVLDSKADALLIPKRSIVYENDQTFAFKVYTDTNGVMRAKRERVVPLNADKEHIEPGSGFDVGERIVVAGHSGLKDDSLIRELGRADAPGAQPPAAIAQTETNAAQKTAAQGGH
jgi:membrane fusion protein, multidrug efflux system